MHMATGLLNMQWPIFKIEHSRKESAHWAVDVTARMYACWLSSRLRCNFWTAFIMSYRLYIYIWPIQNNENIALIKFWVACQPTTDFVSTLYIFIIFSADYPRQTRKELQFLVYICLDEDIKYT